VPFSLWKRAYRKFRRRATNLPVNRLVYFFKKRELALGGKGKNLKREERNSSLFLLGNLALKGIVCFCGETSDIDMI
jgi:hypothetical protein